MSYYQSGTSEKRIEVGEEFAVYFSSTNSDPVVSKILYKQKDEFGKIVYAVLDSLIHDSHTTYIGDYLVSGVIATELRYDDKSKRRY